MTRAVFLFVVCSLIGNIFPLINIAAVLALGLLYLQRGHRRSSDIPVPPTNPARWVIAAYVYWCVSYLLTTAPLSNFFSFDFLRRDGAVFFSYLPLLLLVNYGITETFAQKLVKIYLALMSGVAVLGLAQWICSTSAPGLFPEDMPLVQSSVLAGPLFYGLFAAHNACGAAYCIAALLAVALLLFRRERLRIVAFETLYLAGTLTGLVMSKSRGAYLAFVLATTLMLLSNRSDIRRALKVVALLAAGLIVLASVQPEISDRLKTVTDGQEDPNVVERLIYWQRALAYIQESPLVGIGLGRFNDENLQFSGASGLASVAVFGDVVNDDKHAHNSYLHFLAEGGIVGLILMTGIWLSLFRWVKWARSLLPKYGFAPSLARAIMAAIVMEAYLSLTEHMMNSAVTTLTIFTLFGLLKNVMSNERPAAGARMDHR